MEKFDVVIVGAGAAGMMCAIEAGRRGRSVLLIDHAKRAGEKIRISGGGRCNFTNLNISRERFLSQNQHFALSCLSRYTQWDFIDLIASHNIPYHEKTLGQLFCDNSAGDILAMLDTEMKASGVKVWLGCSVTSVVKTTAYLLETSRGVVETESLVIATGGRSIPKMGATGFGYKIAEQFGVDLIDTRAGLVPLTFGPQDLERIKPLAGVSVEASVSCNKATFDEGLLFTHRGLSGPSVLQISSYWREGDTITVDLLRDGSVFGHLKTQRTQRGRQAVHTVLADVLPRKLAEWVVQDCSIAGNLADQSDASLTNLAERVHAWQVKPTGSEGYRTAEVTLGGVNIDELDARTMEAKVVPGLYFIGEVVDVTGWLGGYNFQWAWSSGWAAGQVA